MTLGVATDDGPSHASDSSHTGGAALGYRRRT
jgi:hypothetical protein